MSALDLSEPARSVTGSPCSFNRGHAVGMYLTDISVLIEEAHTALEDGDVPAIRDAVAEILRAAKSAERHLTPDAAAVAQ